MTRFLSGPCSNRLLLAAVALALWIYFAAICLDCQPAIAAIRDKKSLVERREAAAATTPRPEAIVERWREHCRQRRTRFQDGEDQDHEVREWSEAMTKCHFDLQRDEEDGRAAGSLTVHVQHPFSRIARAYFEYAKNFNEVIEDGGREGVAAGGDDDVLR